MVCHLLWSDQRRLQHFASPGQRPDPRFKGLWELRTADLDEGPIIEQDIERVSHRDAPEELVRKGREIERRVLSRAVRHHLEDRVLLNGNKTIVFPE